MERYAQGTCHALLMCWGQKDQRPRSSARPSRGLALGPSLDFNQSPCTCMSTSTSISLRFYLLHKAFTVGNKLYVELGWFCRVVGAFVVCQHSEEKWPRTRASTAVKSSKAFTLVIRRLPKTSNCSRRGASWGSSIVPCRVMRAVSRPYSLQIGFSHVAYCPC